MERCFARGHNQLTIWRRMHRIRRLDELAVQCFDNSCPVDGEETITSAADEKL